MSKKEIFLLYVRNFIFGAEDSLISTVGLLAGIAAVGMDKSEIILSGLILIFVEAFSMSVGSFLSERTTEEANPHFLRSRSGALGVSVVMFASYLLCGLIPLSPYIFLVGMEALVVSVVASLSALFVLGVVSAEILKTHPMKNALRMFLVGGAAIVLGIVVGSVVK